RAYFLLLCTILATDVMSIGRNSSSSLCWWTNEPLDQKSIHAVIIVSYLTRYLKIVAQDINLCENPEGNR
ncbi:hypothetical protein L9F63_023871, partial [Diploptera punctata]